MIINRLVAVLLFCTKLLILYAIGEFIFMEEFVLL